MSDAIWKAVDAYVTELLVGEDLAQARTLSDSEAAGLPSIAVSAPHGKLLYLLARLRGAKQILEIGTLGGYSAIWMARALPAGGRLISLEREPRHAEVARANIARAGLEHAVEVRVGAALDLLPALAAEQRDAFDLVFIDADKASIPEYFDWALNLSRSGSLIVVDNVVRRGAVIDAESADPNIIGVRRFNERVASEPRVEATTIQTVGSKGYDGFTLALVV